MRHRATIHASSRGGHEGFTLVEMMCAIALLASASLAAHVSLVRGLQFTREAHEDQVALSAVRSLVADIQQTANLPQSIATLGGIGSIYSLYHGATFPLTDLDGGSLEVRCYADENLVPAELGGPQDLNLDGDAADDHSGLGSGTDLRIVPLVISLTWDRSSYRASLVLHRLITQTSN